MRLRTVYFKVSDVAATAGFWGRLLEREVDASYEDWMEYKVGDVRIAFIKETPATGSNCVPVFEMPREMIANSVQHALEIGARIVLNGLDDPEVRSIVLEDPFGNEFEFTMFHD